MTEKLKILPFRWPAIALSDIAGDRDRSSAQLVCKAELFRRRECACKLVYCQTEFNCPLPNDEVLEGLGHDSPFALARMEREAGILTSVGIVLHLGSFSRSLTATGYWLLATRYWLSATLLRLVAVLALLIGMGFEVGCLVGGNLLGLIGEIADAVERFFER